MSVTQAQLIIALGADPERDVVRTALCAKCYLFYLMVIGFGTLTRYSHFLHHYCCVDTDVGTFYHWIKRMATEAAVSTPRRPQIPNSAQRDYYWVRSFVAGGETCFTFLSCCYGHIISAHNFCNCLICVGVAGCCAKSTIAPLDRVKILLQAHNPHYKDLGKEDYKSLWMRDYWSIC